MRLQTEYLLRSIAALEASRREIAEKNARMESDLAMAREVQFAMLPRESSPVGQNGSRLEFAHRYHPAGTMSGDFFDVIRLSETSAGVLVCDVMGHGVRSALITAMIRAMLEPLRKIGDHPGKMLTQLNHDLTPILRQAGGLMFVTAAYAVFDLASMKLRYAQAGHPTPLKWDSTDRAIRPIACTPEAAGPALGLVEDFEFDESEEPLAIGDRWLLFTDGVFEAASTVEEFGMERLGEAFALRMPQTLDESLGGVLESVATFCSGIEPPDDVCLIGVQVIDTHA
jgi:sigma-B regulation protein RsbU (phosphoserine phosphatase)